MLTGKQLLGVIFELPSCFFYCQDTVWAIFILSHATDQSPVFSRVTCMPNILRCRTVHIGQLLILTFFLVHRPFLDVLLISNTQQTIWHEREVRTLTRLISYCPDQTSSVNELFIWLKTRAFFGTQCLIIKLFTTLFEYLVTKIYTCRLKYSKQFSDQDKK